MITDFRGNSEEQHHHFELFFAGSCVPSCTDGFVQTPSKTRGDLHPPRSKGPRKHLQSVNDIHLISIRTLRGLLDANVITELMPVFTTLVSKTNLLLCEDDSHKYPFT